MNAADLNRFVGCEWPLIAIPKKERRHLDIGWVFACLSPETGNCASEFTNRRTKIRREDADKRVEVEIGKYHAKHCGVRSAAKMMADENVPEQVARRVLLGISA